jgi:hypothetical protein
MVSLPRALKIIIAIGLLGLGLAFFLKKHNELVGSPTNLAIGTLVSLHGTVEKKNPQGFIWQALSEIDDANTSVLPGTSLRVLGNGSSARLIFTTKADIDLEPGTEIIFKDDSEKIEIIFISGRLFLRGGQQKVGRSIIVETQGAEITLQDADVDLAYDETATNRLLAEAYRGKALIENQNQKYFIEKETMATITGHTAQVIELVPRRFKMQSPLPGQKIFVRSDRENLMRFYWDALPNNFDVKLLLGYERDSLTTLGSAVLGDTGQFGVHLPPGSYYWQLVATNRNDSNIIFSSNINHNVAVSESAPKLLSPQREVKVFLTEQDKSVIFRWVNPSKLVKLQIEVATDSKFQNTLYANEVEDTGVHQVLIQAEGEYYWRLSGFRPGSAVSLTSEAHHYSIVTKESKNSPELKFPLAKAKIHQPAVTANGLFLSWVCEPGITKYHIRLESIDAKKVVFEKNIEDACMVRIQNLTIGEYSWVVQSIDNTGVLSDGGELRTFTVADSSKTVLAIATPHFSSRMPASFDFVSWDAIAGAQSYWLEIISEDGRLLKTETHFNTFYNFKNLPQGVFRLRIAAIGANQELSDFSDALFLDLSNH